MTPVLPSSIVTDDPIGLVLDGTYLIKERIGAGGMGVVYRAEHLRLGKPLAVKLLRPEFLFDAENLERFRREAIAAGRIGSPHIVEVSDLGRAPDGAPFLVMELLEGRSLADLLRETPVLPVPHIAEIVCQILRGLAAAHERGIVHRDLKPENVYLVRGRDGRPFVKLLDFGVAKILGDRSMTLTAAGMTVGTPRYMSPEQAQGRVDVDGRADVWAAGALLYYGLCGHPPFDGPRAAMVMAAILTTDPSPLANRRPGLDPALEAIVARALTRDREARYPTAAAFEADLRPFASASA
jgi:serine/threonine-protein kinase